MSKPYLSIEWNDRETDAKGWLVIHTLVNGYTSGGIRMNRNVTKEEVKRLAETMAYKYVASESTTTGGCKAGITYDYNAPDAKKVLRRFVIAMMPYIKGDVIDASVSLGEDLGTSYNDILNVFKEFHFDIPITKSMAQDKKVLQGIKDYDRLLNTKMDNLILNDIVTGYGVAFATDEAWHLRQGNTPASVVIQGFGSVGAGCALKLQQLGYQIVGISDANLLVTCQDGLDVETLIKYKNEHGEMDQQSFRSDYEIWSNKEWVNMDCDILIPAAIEDAINENNVEKIKSKLIVEAANNPISAEADEQLKNQNIDVVNDFIANLGSIRAYDAVIFGLISPDKQAVIDDIEQLCRKNVRRLFSESERLKKYQREVAKELFNPEVQSKSV